MADTLTASRRTLEHPKTVYLKDYQLPSYLIDEVHLDFALHTDYAIVISRLLVRHNRHATDSKRRIDLNGEELELVSVQLDGRKLAADEFLLENDKLTIDNVPDNFELEIITKIYPQKNTALSGLYRSAKTFCTQCEAEGFRRITYFLDHPDILSRYTTTISAEKRDYPVLLSNGNLVAEGELANGRHFAKWEDPFRKPCYLFALVAGDFDLLQDKFVSQSGREVALRIYVDKGYLDQTSHAMFALKEAMRWDEIAYGREYDLDIYMIVAIGDFNMGAMENKGLNIFNTKYILAKPATATDDDYIHIMSVITHEYCHNWSGNRVTCRDWFQLSLKEGLTIFRDQSFSEDVISRAVMRIRDVARLREVQFVEDAGPLAHPVRPESYIEINNFYTATIYEKGAEVLRMLQTILGKANFRKGMDLYFAKFDGQAVTIDDFVDTMQDISGIDLKQFRLWYSQAGTPELKVNGRYDAKQQTYTLDITQVTPPTPGQANKHPLLIPIAIGLLDKEGNEIDFSVQNVADDANGNVLLLRQPKQKFVLEKVSSAPVPSLLRHFSAPVKLSFPYTNDELVFLFKYDTDLFNRWEAGQQYMTRVMLDLLDAYQRQQSLQTPTELVSMFSFALQQKQQDQFFLAELLTPPSEKYLSEQMLTIDVDGIHAVREFLLQTLAKQLEPLLLQTYQRLQASKLPKHFDLKHLGERQLKNKMLAYLATLTQHAGLAFEQFSASISTNMTDTLSALAALSGLGSAQYDQALDQFYRQWQHDPLVVDKWLAVQAASKLPDTLARVESLLTSKAFDIKNPNKVYSLIGTFGHRNAVHFHNKQGKGYVFLRQAVQKLDTLNPQVAARMVNPLTNWRRYDADRQRLMRSELELLLKSNKLSPDLYELVTKSLE